MKRVLGLFMAVVMLVMTQGSTIVHAEETVKKIVIRVENLDDLPMDLTDLYVCYAAYGESDYYEIDGEYFSGDRMTYCEFTESQVTLSIPLEVDFQLQIGNEGDFGMIATYDYKYHEMPETSDLTLKLNEFNEIVVKHDSTDTSSECYIDDYYFTGSRMFVPIGTKESYTTYLADGVYGVTYMSHTGNEVTQVQEMYSISESSEISIETSKDSLNHYNIKRPEHLLLYTEVYITHGDMDSVYIDIDAQEIDLYANYLISKEEPLNVVYRLAGVSDYAYDLEVSNLDGVIGRDMAFYGFDFLTFESGETEYYPAFRDGLGNIFDIRNYGQIETTHLNITDLSTGKTIYDIDCSQYNNQILNELANGRYLVIVDYDIPYLETSGESIVVFNKEGDTKWSVIDQNNQVSHYDGSNKPPVVETMGADYFTTMATQEESAVFVDTTKDNRLEPTITLDFDESYTGVAVTLSDVTAEAWYYDNLSYLFGKDVISGYNDGTFRPDAPVNVDAFIKMLVCAIGHDVGNGDGYWASSYIEEAKTLGIIEESYFTDYARPITRGEMALLSTNTIMLIEEITPYNQYQYHMADFDRIPANQKSSAMIAFSKGIITGFNDYTFRADETATRSQSTAIIARIIDPRQRKYQNRFDLMKAEYEEKILTYKSDLVEYFEVIDSTIEQILGEPIVYDSFDDINALTRDMYHDFVAMGSIINTNPLITQVTEGMETVEIDGENWTVIVTDYGKIVSRFADDMTYIHTKGNGINSYATIDYTTDLVANYTFDNGQTNFSIISKGLDDSFGLGYFQGETDYGTSMRFSLTDNYTESFGLVNNDDSGLLMADTSGDEVFVELNDGTVSIYGYTGSETYGDAYLRASNGAYYIGQHEDYSMTGMGMFNMDDGHRVFGEFTDGDIFGQGVTVYNDGVVFEGEMQETYSVCIEASFVREGDSIYSFDDKLDSILSELNVSELSHDETIEAVYDYLIRNIDYSEDTIDFFGLTDLTVNNAYSALVDGETNCLGFAQALNLLLNKAGIESYVVLGDSDQDGEDDHAWNYVKFASGYFHVDVTWDDSLTRGSDKTSSREYFMISESKILEERYIYLKLGLE